ncbi:MAG: hypothetical protein EXS10_09445 [Phycisphaerales bacterium]|nr:hypothetical protein [Phycisphaerales bacterium]
MAALNCFRCQRPRAWRDANAVIAKLIHPHANMPQDALDDLRVVDQTHDAPLAVTLGAQQRIDLPDLLDQLAPRSRRHAPCVRRTMLDDFNRRACSRTITPALLSPQTRTRPPFVPNHAASFSNHVILMSQTVKSLKIPKN